MAEIEFSARFRCKSLGGRGEAEAGMGAAQEDSRGIPRGMPAQR
jgi:hypothetical protein